jgi:hypothetical protein
MKLLISIVTMAVVGPIRLILWSTCGRHARNKNHRNVEYYRSWDGYGLPLHLTSKMTREEAAACEARGTAYLIGYFDADGKLIRDVKMHRGMVFFAHEYTYYRSGKLRRMKVTNARGEVLARDYRESDLPTFVR